MVLLTITVKASPSIFPIRTGTSFLIIPALCNAISLSETPKNSECSMLTEVIIDKTGVKIFVEGHQGFLYEAES